MCSSKPHQKDDKYGQGLPIRGIPKSINFIQVILVDVKMRRSFICSLKTGSEDTGLNLPTVVMTQNMENTLV